VWDLIPSGVQVFLATEPIDLRWSFDRLSGIALERRTQHARGGAVFVFFGKRRDATKILFFDGTGMCLFYKRLDKGVFRVPEGLRPDARHVELSDAELDALLDGIDIDAKVASVVKTITH
jgi:transposase